MPPPNGVVASDEDQAMLLRGFRLSFLTTKAQEALW
jgi:hypothetical protein